jgi:hypothetical protein
MRKAQGVYLQAKRRFDNASKKFWDRYALTKSAG